MFCRKHLLKEEADLLISKKKIQERENKIKAVLNMLKIKIEKARHMKPHLTGKQTAAFKCI